MRLATDIKYGERRSRAAFTLIEILAAIFILTTLIAIGASAFQSALKTSQRKAAGNLLHTVAKHLEAHYQQVYLKQQGQFTAADVNHNRHKAAIIGGTYNRQVEQDLWIVDVFRSEFPESFEDIDRKTGGDNGTANGNDDITFDLSVWGAQHYTDGKTWQAVDSSVKGFQDPPDALVSYRSAISSLFDASSGNLTASHDRESESAECVVLILKASGFDLDALPKERLADSDGDSLLELRDPWNNPVRFYRWPMDLVAYYSFITKEDRIAPGTSSVRNNLYNESGFFAKTSGTGTRTDFEKQYFRLHTPYGAQLYTDQNKSAAAPVTGTSQAWPILLTLVSAGPDGEFGLVEYTDTPSSAGAADAEALKLMARMGRPHPARLADLQDNIVSFLVR